jgi:hypothetical protein
MKTVTNKTNAPIKVPLPRNKILRLGPGHTGQIGDSDAERPALAKMVAAGQIEITDSESQSGNGGGRAGGFGNSGRAGGAAGIGRRGGDR